MVNLVHLTSVSASNNISTLNHESVCTYRAHEDFQPERIKEKKKKRLTQPTILSFNFAQKSIHTAAEVNIIRFMTSVHPKKEKITCMNF